MSVKCLKMDCEFFTSDTILHLAINKNTNANCSEPWKFRNSSACHGLGLGFTAPDFTAQREDYKGEKSLRFSFELYNNYNTSAANKTFNV